MLSAVRCRPGASAATRPRRIGAEAEAEVDGAALLAGEGDGVDEEEHAVALEGIDELDQRAVVAAEAGVDAHLGEFAGDPASTGAWRYWARVRRTPWCLVRRPSSASTSSRCRGRR